MIKKAQLKDLPAIYKLINKAAKTHRILPRTKKELTNVIHSFYIAVENDKVVGCCALEIYNKKIAEIRSLVVLNKYQKKGIGKQLLRACIVKAKQSHIYEVLSITDKIDFFKKSGFHVCLNKQYAMFIRL